MVIFISITLCLILHRVENRNFNVEDGSTSTNLNRTFTDMISIYPKDVTLTYIKDWRSEEFEPMVRTLMDQQLPIKIYTYSEVQMTLVPVMENLMKHASLEQMRDQLQFLVVCELVCVERLFEEMSHLDLAVGQGSLLRHFSTWLIISPDDIHPLNTSFDNVAWIRLRWDEPLAQEHIEGIFTLLWMSGKRTWSCANIGVSGQYNSLFPNLERGLNGRELSITTLEWEGYAVRKTTNGEVTYTGAGMDIVENLKRKFNFSYIIIEPEDNLWGQQFENGSVTGLLGLIHRKEAHLCPSPYAISLTRSRIMDFSSPLGSNDFIFVYRRQTDIDSSWLFLISCFSWPVYLFGAGSLFWIVLVMFLLGRRKDSSSWFDVIFRVPFRQDIQVAPTSMPSRIMVFTWSIFCLMITAVYTSKLVSRSAVDGNTASINTIAELADRTDLHIVIQEGLIVESILKDSNNSIYRKLFGRLVMVQSFENESLDEALGRMLNGPFVALVTTAMKYKMSSKICNLAEIRERIFSPRVGLAYPKQSPLRTLFDKQTGHLVDMGMYAHFINKWFPKPKACETDVHQTQFKMEYLKSVLIVTGCGIIAAGLVLLLERTKLKSCTK